MNTQTAIKVTTIIFDNKDTKVLIKGSIFKNHISYLSELFITFDDLNRLLNYFQQVNPFENINKLMVSEEFSDGYTLSEINAEKLENNRVDLSILSFGGAKKRIRA